MFGYPLPVPQVTFYRELGVGPEATADEIRDAKKEITAHIGDERGAVKRDLEAVYRVVPGLRELHARVRDHQATGSEEELRRVSRELAELEQKAVRVRPDLKQLQERLAELDRRENDLNRTALENPAQRAQYDQAHPPLALLKLADCTRDGFTEARTALMLLRRELSEFLTGRGEGVFHPSDLTRDNFVADFSPHPMLDGERDE